MITIQVKKKKSLSNVLFRDTDVELNQIIYIAFFLLST